MKIKMNKIILTIFIYFFGFVASIKAADLEIPEITDTINFSKKGSINVTLEEKESQTKIEGAEITIYQIANATEKNNNLAFEYTDELKNCQVDLENLQVDDLTSKISQCLTSETANIKKTTNKNGLASFKDLTLGLYLVRQTNQVEGYSQIDDFLVMLPKVENNKWIYSINAQPKTDIFKVFDLKVIKVWNQQNKEKTHPQEVIINLYKDEKLIDTITLNEKNNWTYTWENIEKSDKYTVVENEVKGYTATYQKEGNVFTITNTDKLAETGQIYLPIIILSSIGTILILLGFFQIKRHSNEE